MPSAATAILLLNVGTPDSPGKTHVRKYLSEFLNDKRVIDLPWLLRKILVNLMIVPFRASHSSKLYQRLWTENGSPLAFNGTSLKNSLQQKMGERFIVEFATNYGQPNIKEITDKVLKQNVKRIIAFPLFPQYSSSTTGSAIEKLLMSLAGRNSIPEVKTITQYYDNPLYLEAMRERISRYDHQGYDHILMSFHGLPVSHVNKSHEGKTCEQLRCREKVTDENLYCYQAACFETARLLAEKLEIEAGRYTVCFQSRFGRKWLSPFTSDILISLAKEGRKRLLVISPSFTADCLETTIEIGQEYRDLFILNGGKDLTLVESLNDSRSWVEAISGIIGEG